MASRASKIRLSDSIAIHYERMEPPLTCHLPERVATEEQLPSLVCHVLDTGSCMVPENHLVTSGRHIKVPIHAIAVLLRHPNEGWFLFDTGYAPRILDATASFPFRIYRWVTPLTVPDELAIAKQLDRFGLRCEDIASIVLSHFHADHIAGLLDFRDARLIAGRDAWEAVRDLRGVRALTRGFIPTLMPPDFESRASLVNEFNGPLVAPFGNSHDLFGDGSALLVRLPGHARGQLGLLANTVHGPIFFVADSYWMPTSLERRELPHRITRYFGVDNWAVMAQTLYKVSDFALANPEVRIVPTHCPDAYRRAMAELR
jgi:glyoxylase-like metal-dependent hydrolase (beta-lactamase superfamily II)